MKSLHLSILIYAPWYNLEMRIVNAHTETACMVAMLAGNKGALTADRLSRESMRSNRHCQTWQPEASIPLLVSFATTTGAGPIVAAAREIINE
jgi:hypothetical protein